MSQNADASYIGKGEIYIQPYDGLSKMRSVGNCSELTFNHATEQKSILDYTNAGGGKANSLDRITGVTASIKAYDFSAENWALGALGSVSAITAAAITAEAHVGYKGSLVPFTNLPDLTVAPVVKDDTDTTTYTVGTDYILDRAGIYILPGSTIPDAIAGAVNLHIGYTKLACNVVQAMIATAQNYKLIFSGLNEAQSGKATVITVHKFKPGAAQNVPAIGDDFATLDLPGEALSDAAITGSGLSKFYKVMMV